MTLLRTRPAPAIRTVAPALAPPPEHHEMPGHQQMFRYGVGSADPTASAIIIWTLLTPPRPSVADGASHSAFPVEWELSSDPQFRHDVRRGYASRGASEYLTVRANICGLAPNTPYYYRFHAQADTSSVGRTRTGPAEQRALPRPALVLAWRHLRGGRRLGTA